MADPDRLTIVLLAPANSVHTSRWATVLARAGHRVIVASWTAGPPLPGVDTRTAPAAGPAASRRAAQAMSWLRLPVAALWLRRLIAHAGPDVVHVHSLGIHGLLSLALPRGPARILTPWGSELRAARRSRPRAAVVRLALRRADLVLPTSRAVAAEATSRYAVSGSRVRVLSWGVDEALIAAGPVNRRPGIRPAFGIPPDATVVLSIRSASATYRTREIVSAFAAALPGRPSLFLVVLTGHRPDPPAARAAQQDYLRQVRWLARAAAPRILLVDRLLTPGQTFEFMCASDIAVSVPDGDQRSSSVLEAALAGCHLLLSDIAPYRELAADGLAADLLAEPVTHTLASRLRVVSPDRASQHRNRRFIQERERGDDKAESLQQIYRQLAARR